MDMQVFVTKIWPLEIRSNRQLGAFHGTAEMAEGQRRPPRRDSGQGHKFDEPGLSASEGS